MYRFFLDFIRFYFARYLSLKEFRFIRWENWNLASATGGGPSKLLRLWLQDNSTAGAVDNVSVLSLEFTVPAIVCEVNGQYQHDPGRRPRIRRLRIEPKGDDFRIAFSASCSVCEQSSLRFQMGSQTKWNRLKIRTGVKRNVLNTRSLALSSRSRT